MEPLVSLGRFQLLRRLGAGGTGVVYEAIDVEHGARVALKTLHARSADAVLQLKNEFRALQEIQHPNLVTLHELICDRGVWLVTMELVDGVDFLAWTRHAGDAGDATTAPTTAQLDEGEAGRAWQPLPARYDEARLRQALPQLAAGLCALHAAGRVHRDIKPANVRVTPSGRVVVLDFGLAARRDQAATLDDWGTAEYMAPEQRDGRAGPAADAYAVGAVLYHALVGRPPFVGTREQILVEKRRSDPTPPELVVEAPADLALTCRELLQRDPARRPALATLAGAPATTAHEAAAPERAPFVGRARELSFLREALEAARAGGSLAAWVHGESGVGKSALVEKLVSEAEGQGVQVLSSRCYERESVPYKAVDGLVDELTRRLVALPESERRARLPGDAELVAAAFPVFRRVVPAPQPQPNAPPGDPRRQRARLFAALRDLVAAVAAGGPLLIVIDDLQWADADSRALLAELVRSPRLLLVATLRAPELAPPVDVEVRTLAVERLSREEAEALAAQLGGVARAAAIAREAGGHPLFIDALARAPGEQRAAFSDRTGAGLLEAALLARLRAHGEEAQRIVAVASVAGAPLSQAVAAAAAQLDFGGFALLASRLRAARLLRTGGARREDPVEPYHDRVRQAVLAGLSPPSLQQLHAQLGIALEAHDGDPEALAMHWAGAGQDARAARFAERAAARADAAYAFDRAARLYGTALDLGRPTGETRVRLLVRRGEALANANRAAEAADVFAVAAREAPTDEALELSRRAAHHLLRCGRVDDGLAAFRTLLARAGVPFSTSPRRALPALVGQRVLLALRGTKFRERAADAIAPEHLRRVDVAWSAATGLAMLDPINGLALQTRALRYALDAGEPDRIARALATEAACAATMGGRGLVRAAELLSKASAIAARLEAPYPRGVVDFCAGLTASFAGEWQAALDHCRAAQLRFRGAAVGAGWELHIAQLYALYSLYFLGRLRELGRLRSELLAEARAHADLFAEANLSTGLPTMALLAADAPDEAERDAAETMARWSQRGFHAQHVQHLLTEVEVDLYRGQAARAQRRIAERWPAMRDALVLRVQSMRIEMLYLRGRCALAASDGADSAAPLVQEADRCARSLGKEGMAWSTALGDVLAAGVLRRRGDDEASLARLRRAVDGLERVGLLLVAASVRRRLGELARDVTLVAAADAWMINEAVARPERISALLAPV